MPVDTILPDLRISLRLDPYAPRAARYYVAQVDNPSPDLRDAVVLLTSELVSRAVQHSGSVPCDSLALRAWMAVDVVRVELRAPSALLELPEESDPDEYDIVLLDQIADRWSVDAGESSACMWFEIDRRLYG